MRIKAATPIIIIGFIIAILCQSIAIAAIDAPHNASNMNCGSCHGYEIFWVGTGSYDALCQQCHKVSSCSSEGYPDTNAPQVKTHSDSSGNALAECRTCHNPHYQRQKNYKNTDPSNYYLAKGQFTVCSPGSDTSTLTYSTITYKTETGWDATRLTGKTDICRRTILFPNVNKLGYSYPITGVDEGTNTITVKGNACEYLSLPSNFAVIYSQYIKDSILTNEDTGTYSIVKLFDKEGTNSFADGDGTYNGVCEVCHTQTKYFRYDGGVLDQIHINKVRTNCISCHSHVEGFKPSCKSCHGFPPTVNTPTAPDGLMWVLPYTGSTTAGAHSLHATASGKNYPCDTCHYQNLSQDKHNKDPRAITLGFYMFSGAYQGGNYDGQILSPANYDATTTSPATTVSETGAKTCSTIYCHGGSMAPNGGTAEAIWNNPASAACGTCHGASASNPPIKGSHQKHAGSGLQLSCSDCHKGYTPSTIPSGIATHVNNQANFAFDTSKNNIGASASYNGTPTMLDPYGQCSNTYCHGSGTPQWGATNTNPDCTWCHGGNAASAAPITLVNHPAHMNQASVLGTNYECAQCHNTTVSVGNDRLITGTVHANGTKDISMLRGGTWNTGTKNCANTYCHSSGKGTYANPPTWGTATGTYGCNSCHGISNAIGWPDYANEGAGLPNANSHISHVTISADCNTCHTNTTTTGTAIKAGSILHTNQALDVNFDTTKAGGSATWTAGTKTCSNISCHCDTNAQWGQTLTCIDCHSGSCGNRTAITSQFSANSHHIQLPQGVPLTGTHCYQCHWEADSNGGITSYHGGSANPGSAVDLVIYGEAGTRPAGPTYTSVTGIAYTANGSRTQIKELNTHCLSCHSTQNNSATPFGDGKTPNYYAWDGTSVGERYSQLGTTAWVRYGGDADVPIINESFEETKGGGKDGYDEFSQGAKADATLEPDYTPIPGTPPSGVDFGSQCLQSAVVLNHGKQAYATRDLGSEITKTVTSFYLYVENAQEFTGDSYKNIAILKNSEGANNVIIFRLFYIGVNQLQFNLRIYNNGWQDYYYPATGYISLSTWYKIDIKYDNINDTWEWRVDGEIQPDPIFNNNALTGTHRDGIQIWDFGFIGTGVSLTGTIYFDLISVEGHNIGNFTPKNTQTKAYSAHGNAINNQGGWDLNETWPNKRNGTEDTKNIACFDCHNSHGSSASGVTSSYTSNYTGAPVNGGGILKNTAEGKGGYSMNYQPQAGGSTANKNAYNAGAGLCFDCHLNATSGTTPWGYQSPFGAAEAIMGYLDTPYFGPGTYSGPQQRFLYKAITPPYGTRSKGGHFGASSTLSSTPTATIGGLCTPCHDPHGVTDNTDKIAAADKQYAVPLLKGTWLTSFYKEDRAPENNAAGTIRTDRGKEGVQYHIDQNTLGSEIGGTGIHMGETDTQFAGLCLKCHPKSSLTNGTTHTWRSKDRVHESVKGWKTTPDNPPDDPHPVKHNYSCSKCHAPHNARLPRLMVTNCLDRRLKGRKESIENNNNPVLFGEGSGCMCGTSSYYALLCESTRCEQGVYPNPDDAAAPNCYGESNPITGLGYCPDTHQTHVISVQGKGSGSFPGKWRGGWADSYNPPYWPQYGNYDSVTCHENNDTYQGWNIKTQWYNDRPVITSGPMAGTPTLVVADIQVTITWTTDIASTSYVDYGVTQAYGSTAGNSTLVTNHSVTLTGLTNYSTHHYKVRSAGPQGTEVESGDNTLDYVSFPPLAPTLIPEEDNSCPASCTVTLEWNEAINPGNGGPVEYQVQVKKQTTTWANSEYDSVWTISGTSYEITIRPDPDTTWNWRVRARDTDSHLTSDWSSEDSFTVTQPPGSPPLDPILINEPDIVSPVPADITLQWGHITYSDPVDYFVQVNSEPDFSGSDPDHNHISDWIPEGTLCVGSTCSWTLTLPTDTTWYWRVQARNQNDHGLVSPWSTVDSFTIYPLIINESFERNPGYDEAGLWTEINNPDEDYLHSAIPGAPTPPTGAGSECLQSVSASPGYQAYATRDYGSEQTKTFTSFYIYVGAKGLTTSTQKDIGTLSDNGGNNAIILRLFQTSADNLKFRFRLYNNGGWTNYESTIISLNTWYKIDIKYDDINHTWEWRLDGITQDPGTPSALIGDHRNGIRYWNLGFMRPGTDTFTGTVYFDLIKVNTLYYQ